jgi:hypothetical protein
MAGTADIYRAGSDSPDGLLVPWIFSAIYILPISPFPGLDLPPIGFAITGLLERVGKIHHGSLECPVSHGICPDCMRKLYPDLSR